MLQLIKRYWPTGIVILVILYATLMPDPLGDEEMPMIPHLDKLIHAVMMGGLVGALTFDYRRADRSRELSPRVMSVIFLFVVVFSFADEWLQGVINIGRESDPLDIVADIAGAVVAVFTAPPAVRRIFPNQRQT